MAPKRRVTTLDIGPPPDPQTTPFAELQEYWYNLAETSGFIDIERSQDPESVATPKLQFENQAPKSKAKRDKDYFQTQTPKRLYQGMFAETVPNPTINAEGMAWDELKQQIGGAQVTHETIEAAPIIEVVMRATIEADAPFIASSYRMSWWKGSTHTYYQPYGVNEKRCMDALDRLLARGATITIAANSEDLGQIFGWICTETIQSNKIVHYIFVKEAFRRFKIAKQLLSDAGIDLQKPVLISHATYSLKKCAPKFEPQPRKKHRSQPKPGKYSLVLLPQLLDYDNKYPLDALAFDNTHD